jgi:cob(I)alamin adenosyltransferase
MAAQLLEIQHDLFDLGQELAIRSVVISAAKSKVEALVDTGTPAAPLREFVLPGGRAAAASCHHARSSVAAPSDAAGRCRETNRWARRHCVT